MVALVSVIPIILLFVLMMGFKVPGWKSALVTLVVTILLALFAAPAMGIIPDKYQDVSIWGITFWSVVEGFLKACFPIILIIICAIFSYNILVETKQITAENMGLKPKPIKMAAGMATAVPKPAIPSNTPPNPQVSNNTSRPLSPVSWMNWVLMVSISLVSTRML